MDEVCGVHLVGLVESLCRSSVYLTCQVVEVAVEGGIYMLSRSRRGDKSTAVPRERCLRGPVGELALVPFACPNTEVGILSDCT